MIRYVIGDQKPDLVFQLVQEDGVTPLSSIASCTFKLRKPSGAVLSKSLSLADGTTQRWEGSFGVGEVNESGEMLAELVAVDATGKTQHSIDAIPVYVRPEFVEAQV